MIVELEGGDEGGEEAPETETVASEPASPETEAPEEGAEAADPATEPEELEDWEYNGQKHSVPKKWMDVLRPGLMTQADYTRKTQDISSKSQIYDTYINATAEKIEKIGDLRYSQQMLEQFANLNWAQMDQATALQNTIARDQWRDRAMTLQQQIAEHDYQSQQAQQQMHAKRVEEAIGEVKKAIPNWDSVKSKVGEFAVSTIGLTQQELASMAIDPRAVRMLHAAWKGSQLEAAQKAAAAKKPAEESEVQPAAKAVRGNANARTGPSDRMNIEDWMKARNKQAAR